MRGVECLYFDTVLSLGLCLGVQFTVVYGYWVSKAPVTPGLRPGYDLPATDFFGIVGKS